MKILVCMDSSIYADEIIKAIGRRDWASGVQLRLITVVQTSSIADHDNEMLQQAGQILHSRVKVLQERMKEANADISGEVLEGNPASCIIQAAEDCCADLILIGSHGDTGIRKTGIGSVAAAVVNEAPCSVEVVKISNRGTRRVIAEKIVASSI